jgi:type II secretory pathway component GspD/PulD (secretin)
VEYPLAGIYDWTAFHKVLPPKPTFIATGSNVMSSVRRSILAGIATASVISFIGAQAVSQSTNSTLGELKKESVQQSLGLSDKQIEDLDEVSKNAKPDFRKMLGELRDAKDDAAKDAIRESYKTNTVKMREDASAKAYEILSDEQKQKLSGLLIKRDGVSSLLQSSVASQLKLSKEQQEKIKKSLSDRRAKRRSSDYLKELQAASSREERQKIEAKLDVATLANLSADQRKAWDGYASVSAVASNSPRRRGGTGSPAAAGTSTASTEPASISFGPADEDENEDNSDKPFSFNSKGAPWSMVLQVFADRANLTLDMHATPPGSFTHTDSTKYTPRKALDIMNGSLLREGYLTVQKDNFMIVWKFDDGLPPSLVPEVSPEKLIEDYSDIDNQLLTVAFKMESGDVEQVAREVDLMLDPYPFVRIAALTGSNTLIVTDLCSNLRKVKRIIDESTGKIVFRQFAIKNMGADEASVLVRQQLGLPPSATNVSENRSRRTTTQATELTVTPDNRTNSLLISATSQQLKRVDEILAAIDVNEDALGNMLGGRNSNVPVLEVYTMTASNVTEVGKTIEILMPGRIVNEDVRAKKLHIKAIPREHDEIRQLIAKLDQGGGGDGATAVIHLHEMDVLQAQQMLTTMFAKEADGGPVIQADPYNQRLICRGNSDQLNQIKSVLSDIGEDGTRRPKTQMAKGTTRQFPMGGRDPQRVMRIMQELMSAPKANPIRLVIPSRQSPVKDSVIPGRNLQESFRPSQPAPQAPAAGSGTKSRTTMNSSSAAYAFTALFQDDEQENAELLNQFSALSGSPRAETKMVGDPEKPEVMVTYQGDTLIVSSDDTAALARAEDIMDTLNQTMPVRNSWTIFYLTSADCTEAAAMLEQLFPTSSVSNTATDSGSMMGGLTSGLSGFGSSLMDMTGLNTIGTGPQSLRIVPDVRANSLMVAGPPYLVGEVEEMLRVLDMSELPQSGRALTPRAPIHLKHADATTVGDKVRELFKTYLEPQRAQGAQSNNPFSALMGGGGGGGGRGQTTPVRLAITIDQNSNRIYCSCSEQVYQEVRGVCESMDQFVAEAKPGIKIFTLRSANAKKAVETITSMLPRAQMNGGSSTNRRGNTTSTQTDAARAQQDRLNQLRAAGVFGGGFGGNTTGRGATGRGGATGGRGGATGGGRGGRGGGGGGGRGGR